jgi:hypothetical protein
MEISPVLGPSGEPLFTAGGRAAWRTEQHRGWVGSFEWTKRRRKFVPTLVVWPANSILRAEGSGSTGMWAITLPAMTDLVGFDKEGRATGGPSKDLLREAWEALAIFGKAGDRQAWHSLIDAVVFFAPQLVMTPAAPATVKRALAEEAMWDVEAIQKTTGKTISEASI